MGGKQGDPGQPKKRSSGSSRLPESGWRCAGHGKLTFRPRGHSFPLSHAQRNKSLQESSAIGRSSRKEFTAKLKLEEIDYKRLDVLARFLNPIGKIDAARRTGASRKQQARIVQAIKRARFLGLLPYTINDSR